jgi:hypothetical protein
MGVITSTPLHVRLLNDTIHYLPKFFQKKVELSYSFGIILHTHPKKVEKVKI